MVALPDVAMPIRILALIAVVFAVLLCPAQASAEQRVHVVAKGHTLGKIAKRYHVSIAALCDVNKINRRDALKIGQKLVIPSDKPSTSRQKDDDDEDDDEADSPPEPKAPEPKAPEPKAPEPTEKSSTKSKASSSDSDSTRAFGSDGMRELAVPGSAPAYYYPPTGPGRKSLRPVIMYLHGRGGSPIRDCRRWASVARRFGWLVCPSGPSAHGDGRDWNNNWALGQRVALSTLQALRKVYGRRVQLIGNTIIGFSEGAYVALNVGVREPRTFNRWLILAGNTSYWGGLGYEELKKNSRRLKRVYLITGEQDTVIEGTRQLHEWLERARVSTRVSMPKDMGHEVALERKSAMYRAALHWLDRGTGAPARSKKASKSKKSSRRRR